MPKSHSPRKGSLQFWPRKRSRRVYAKVSSWAKTDKTKSLAFIGYKAGMTHLLINDNKPTSPTKGQDIFCPVTVIECPPIKPLSFRLYKNSQNGLKLLTEVFSKNLDKELKRKIKLPKKQKESRIPENFDEIRLVIHSQPKLTGIGKKKPEIIEVSIGGKDNKEKLEYAKSILDKELKISNIFEEGQLLDIHAITKGKGFQGVIKKYGIKLRQHKSEKGVRRVGSIGAWTPTKVSWRAPMPGKIGFHLRTEYNKLLIKLGNNAREINQKGGFLHYGLIKNDYVILKGSIPGPAKRPIVLTKAIRSKAKDLQPQQISFISTSSQQGN